LVVVDVAGFAFWAGLGVVASEDQAVEGAEGIFAGVLFPFGGYCNGLAVFVELHEDERDDEGQDEVEEETGDDADDYLFAAGAAPVELFDREAEGADPVGQDLCLRRQVLH
jgi:hypothetical protein